MKTTDQTARIIIRPLREEDLPGFVEVDYRQTGKRREAYWRDRFAHFTRRHPLSCLVAEMEGVGVVASVLGDVRGWEFGVPEGTGWIEGINVRPDLQGTGIASRLLDQLLGYFRQAGVKRVFSVVDWEQEEAIGLFRSHGFRRGDFIAFEKKL
ncbi:MAG: GNAT family N-acetyltransferase [Chloroflexi bacterium]|nr:GNAT family N-acetyltransferase [Chloroflexota bacterium]